MSKITLANVRTLAERADEAAHKAAEIIRPAHDKALDAAQRLRDQLASSTTEASKRDRLARIVEAATDTRSPNRDACATVLAQYLNGTVSTKDVTQAQQRDGAFLWNTLHRYTWDWAEAQRRKVLDTLVLASRGEVDPGLVQFPAQWSDCLSLDDAEKLAELADAKAFARYRRDQDKLAAEFAEAQRYVDGLEQATPHLFTLSTGEGATVAVRNHRPGDITVAGIRFSGGHVTELSPEEFDRVRDESMFKAHQSNGNFEVTTPAQLAEAV